MGMKVCQGGLGYQGVQKRVEMKFMVMKRGNHDGEGEVSNRSKEKSACVNCSFHILNKVNSRLLAYSSSNDMTNIIFVSFPC